MLELLETLLQVEKEELLDAVSNLVCAAMLGYQSEHVFCVDVLVVKTSELVSKGFLLLRRYLLPEF